MGGGAAGGEERGLTPHRRSSTSPVNPCIRADGQCRPWSLPPEYPSSTCAWLHNAAFVVRGTGREALRLHRADWGGLGTPPVDGGLGGSVQRGRCQTKDLLRAGGVHEERRRELVARFRQLAQRASTTAPARSTEAGIVATLAVVPAAAAKPSTNSRWVSEGPDGYRTTFCRER